MFLFVFYIFCSFNLFSCLICKRYIDTFLLFDEIMFVIFYLLFVYYQYPIYFCSVFIQVDMSILYLVSISCVAMCGIEAHLWPIVKDLCNKKVVQFWARCYVLAGFGQDRLQPVCGWHAQSLARLSGGHRVQTMTNPDPNQADQMGPSDWLWREAGQHFSRGNNKYTATAMWLLCNFFFLSYILYVLYTCHDRHDHTQAISVLNMNVHITENLSCLHRSLCLSTGYL